MDLLKYLKQMLGEEEGQKAYDKIKADKDNVLLVDSKKESKYVEKTKLDDANSTIEDYKGQIKDRDKQLNGLKDKAKDIKDVKELEGEIEKLKLENEKATKKYEEDLKTRDFDYSLEKALTVSKAKNAMAVKALLNLENIKVDGNDLIGLNEQLDKLKESDSYLFEVEEEEGGTGTLGGGGDLGGAGKTESLGERLAKERAEAIKVTEAQNKFFE